MRRRAGTDNGSDPPSGAFGEPVTGRHLATRSREATPASKHVAMCPMEPWEMPFARATFLQDFMAAAMRAAVERAAASETLKYSATPTAASTEASFSS